MNNIKEFNEWGSKKAGKVEETSTPKQNADNDSPTDIKGKGAAIPIRVQTIPPFLYITQELGGNVMQIVVDKSQLEQLSAVLQKAEK